jgi:hypothetical protein
LSNIYVKHTDLTKLMSLKVLGFEGTIYRIYPNEGHFIRELLERGVPLFPDPERAARAIKVMVKYADLWEKILTAGMKLKTNSKLTHGKHIPK